MGHTPLRESVSLSGARAKGPAACRTTFTKYAVSQIRQHIPSSSMQQTPFRAGTDEIQHNSTHFDTFYAALKTAVAARTALPVDRRRPALP